jgi:hypothetical protein
MNNLTVENIYIRSIGILKIYLSDSFIEILNAYITETGNGACFSSEIKWYSNSKLFKSIKDIMLANKTKYSLIFYKEGVKRIIIISKKENNKWFSLFYTVTPSETEREQYFRKKYPFNYYKGYITGCICGFVAFPFYKFFGIKILPDRYYNF